MPFSKLPAALAALVLAAAPAAAQPAPAVEPAPEQTEASALRGEPVGYFLLPALVVLALLIAMLAGGDEERTSP